jgi:hypothetical protein
MVPSRREMFAESRSCPMFVFVLLMLGVLSARVNGANQQDANGEPLPSGQHMGAEGLPGGVLSALRGARTFWCEDQYGDKRAKGCGSKFNSHLKWTRIVISPDGETGILMESQNVGSCGSGGCALYLCVEREGGKYRQVLGTDGGLGDLERVSVLKRTTKGHFDLRVGWRSSKGQSIYRWNGKYYDS